MKVLGTYLFRIGFALYATIIAALSLINFESTASSSLFFDGFDKVVHFCFYLGFSVLLAQAFIEGFKEVNKVTLRFWVIVYSLFYGGMIEFAQMWLTTYRQADWNDFYANALGVAVGVVLHPYLSRVLLNAKSRNN
ncbi:MAG: VanZ family protein [Flavobacteriaceae bacterium]